MNASVRAFVSDLAEWSQGGDRVALVRIMRSPFSGVPHDIAAAYATIAGQTENVLDAIASGRLALPAHERDSLFSFSERVRAVAGGADALETFLETSNPPQTEAEQAAEIAFAEAEGRETGKGMRPRQSHFSASALNTYAECARKWYYRYVCSAVEDPASSASTYGTAFHSALEDFHGEFPHPDSAHENAMRSKIVGYVNWAFERFRDDFGSVVEVELHKRRAQRTAQRYVDWLVAQSRRAPFTVVGRELAANLCIEGYDFVGYIDRVDRDDASEAATIIDYKTGSISTTAAEYREKIRTFRDFQLPFYYWARTAAGDRVSKLALIPLKDALLEVTPVALEVVPGSAPPGRQGSAIGTISIADLERSRARMIEICGELSGGDCTEFNVTDDPSACTYCAYRTACNERPYSEREKFGR